MIKIIDFHFNVNLPLSKKLMKILLISINSAGKNTICRLISSRFKLNLPSEKDCIYNRTSTISKTNSSGCRVCYELRLYFQNTLFQ